MYWQSGIFQRDMPVALTHHLDYKPIYSTTLILPSDRDPLPIWSRAGKDATLGAKDERREVNR